MLSIYKPKGAKTKFPMISTCKKINETASPRCEKRQHTHKPSDKHSQLRFGHAMYQLPTRPIRYVPSKGKR